MEKDVCGLERLRILIKAHQVKQIILISHSDCGFYKAGFSNASEKEISKKQLNDIQKAVQKLKYLFSNISIYCFHAHMGNSKIIEYTQICID